MTYKKKATILLVLVVVLAVLYILTFVFDPENRQDSAFAWLDPSLVAMADRIEISGPNGGIQMSRRNDFWLIADEASEYPAKQDRVRDFFALLTRKEAYPLRASSSEGIERLGLNEERASRIVVRGGAGLPLMDLLLGSPDTMGRSVYLRRAGLNQIYSAEDSFSFFTESDLNFWQDLRLFPQLSIDAVQQAEVTLPGMETYIIRRTGRGWFVPGNETVSLSAIMVEAWLRTLLESEGNDFGNADPKSIEAAITLRFGDGSAKSLQAGPIEENGFRSVMVSGSPFIFLMHDWTFDRYFRDISFFVSGSS